MEQIAQWLLLHHAKFAHSDFIGTIQPVNQLQKRIFRVPISEALEMARSAAVCTAGTAAQGSLPMLLQQKYPQVQSWWAAGVSPIGRTDKTETAAHRTQVPGKLQPNNSTSRVSSYHHLSCCTQICHEGAIIRNKVEKIPFFLHFLPCQCSSVIRF